MTHAELFKALVVERYGIVIRAPRTWLAPDDAWTPAEQRRHLATLDEAIRDHDARIRHLEVA